MILGFMAVDVELVDSTSTPLELISLISGGKSQDVIRLQAFFYRFSTLILRHHHHRHLFRFLQYNCCRR